MCRSFSKQTHPANNKSAEVDVYTYHPTPNDLFAGLTWLGVQCQVFRTAVSLQPAEARAIAQALLDGAAQAEADMAAASTNAPAQQPEQVPA